MLRFHALFPIMLMAAAGDGGAGGGGAAATMEVDIDGLKVTLPKDQAEQLIAKRQATKDEQRKLNERLGALEAEKRTAEEKAAAAQREKEAAEALKAGDIKKLEEIHTSKLSAERAKLGAKLRDKGLAAVVAKAPKVVPSAVDDITEQLRARTQYDFDSDSVIVLNAAGQPQTDDSGKPVTLDSFIGSWLEKRPHYLLDSTPSGSGAAGGGKPPAAGKVITSAQFEALTPMEQAKHLAGGGGIAKG